jgi:hypothetical protein
LGLRPLKHRIGSDGSRLHVRLDDGRELAIAPSALACTDRLPPGLLLIVVSIAKT